MKNTAKVSIAFLMIPALLTGCTQEKMKVKNNTVSIEYGNPISTDIKTYLDNTEEYIKDTKLTGIPENEKDKQYPAASEYEIILSHGKETQKIKVSVKDTVSPTFKDVKDTYEVEYGKKLDIQNIKTEDLAKVTVTIDDSKVNYKKAGTYKATLSAKDESGNETKKEISIKVKAEEKKETESTSPKNNTSSSTNTKSSSKASSSKKSSSSSKSSSTDKKSSSSDNQSSKTSEVTAEWDKDSYYEFNDGGNWAIGSEDFEWPSDWE